MAINNDDLEKTNDLATSLKNMLSDIADNVSARLNSQFQASQRSLADMRGVFEEVLATSEDLSKNFFNVHDLEKKMLHDSRLFSKVEKEINELLKNQHKLRKNEILAVAKEEKKTLAEVKVDMRLLNQHHRDMVELVQNELEVRRKKAELIKLEQLSLGNIKKAVDDLGNKIRNPDAMFSSVLAKAGDLPSKLFEASKGSKNFGETISKVAGPALQKMQGFAKVLFSPAGLLIGGVLAAVAALSVLYKLFSNYWEFLDKKAMPAQAAFNREIGNTSEGAKQLKGDMMSAGVEFELLGKSFQEGVQFVNDFAKGLGFTSEATKKAQRLGKELALTVGLTAEEAGKTILQFRKQGKSLEDVREMFGVAEKAASSYGVPVNEVLRDIGKYPNILARFGVVNRKEFASSAAKARSYGLTIQDINQAFGKQLDTFEGSSEAAAKLNAIFGSQINSFELMLETDPTKRMEMLRKELVNQGKEWNKLSVFEKNVITQNLGVDESQAALILSSEEERKKLELKAKQREKQIKLDERWNRTLGQAKETLIAWGPTLDKVMRSITNFVNLVLFNIDTSKDMSKTAQKVQNSLEGLSGWFDNLTVAAGEEGFTGILVDLPKLLNSGKSSIKDITNGLEEARKVIRTVKEVFEQLGNAIKFSWEMAKLFSGIKLIEVIAQFAGAISGGASIGDATKMVGRQLISDYTWGGSKPEAVGLTSAPAPTTISAPSAARSVAPAAVSQGTRDVKIEVMDVNIDGKKVGEAQVRISRY